MQRQNRIMMFDSYKYSHAKTNHKTQYPANTVSMYDYAEARSSKVYNLVQVIGLQIILKQYFCTPIEAWEVIEAKAYAEAHGIPFNEEGWWYIVYGLGGYLPVEIKAVPEGTVMPTNVPLFTVESTDINCFWVVSCLETPLMRVWYTSNIATRSYFVKQMLMKYAEMTQENPFVDYQFHNFGARGSSSDEAARIGGVAHLAAGFMGTDNFYSIKDVVDFYPRKKTENETLEELIEREKEYISSIGHSIPASEHSTTTSWGRDGEFDMIMNHIEDNKGAPIIAAVMDSYDYYAAVENIATGEFKEKIESDEYPIFVIRPDSGEPAEVIPRTLDILEGCGVKYTTNDKGYKVFNKYRIIWGDGINMDSMKAMLDILVERRYSTENIAFGSGGWLMQQHDRDTQGWAIKCSSITVREHVPGGDCTEIEIVDVERDVYKDPITASNKASKKGRISTFKNRSTGEIKYMRISEADENWEDMLVVVYRNGEMIKEYSFDEVRQNSMKG